MEGAELIKQVLSHPIQNINDKINAKISNPKIINNTVRQMLVKYTYVRRETRTITELQRVTTEN
jgi:hypothetical protein